MNPPSAFRAAGLSCLLGIAILSGLASVARAQTSPELYALYSSELNPGALVQGADGSFYGTTNTGPNGSVGGIFKVTAQGVFTTLFNFSPLDPDGRNLDGQSPLGALVQGTDGNFYGVTSRGGLYAHGTFFQMTPSGVLTTLHAFGKTADDVSPSAGLLRGSDGNFYGVSRSGGVDHTGRVFKATTDGIVTGFYDFLGGTDPAQPGIALAQDADGNFYGVTADGGTHGAGTAFRLSADGTTLTVLHSFSATDANGANRDGTAPQAALTRGRDGNFYGVTETGGARGAGVVFKVTPAGKYVNLHNFNPEDDDGLFPYASLTLGRDGNFYGTTEFGGASGNGTLFRIKPAGVETILHNFTSTDLSGRNPEGARPLTTLVQGKDNNLYGTTLSGGADAEGTVFLYGDGPTITSPLTTSLTFDQPFSYQITATGSPTRYSASGLRAGLHLDPATGLISGTVSDPGGSHEYVRTYHVTLKATNITGTTTATLIITASFAIPVITSPTSASGTVGQPFSYQITATNDPTSYGGTSVRYYRLPPGLNLDYQTGLITGTPTQAGTFNSALFAYNHLGFGQLYLAITIAAQ